MAELRTDPYFIDINLVTSLDMLQQLTDYVDTLTTFPDETAINHMYWHTLNHSDPITSRTEFFRLLNNNQLPVKDNADGVKQHKTDITKLQNKNIRDQLHDAHHLVTQSGDKYDQAKVTDDHVDVNVIRTEKTWTPIHEGEIHENSNGTWSIKPLPEDRKQVNVHDHTQVQQQQLGLSEEFGMQDMSAWFKMWWMEKFYSSHRVIKDELRQVLGDDNEYFVNFSESVGQLKNIKDSYNINTTPVGDLNVDSLQDDSIPSTITSVAKYCTKQETNTLADELSKKTNIIFRKNIFSHCDDSSRDVVINKLLQLPTASHGCNLIHDAEHPKRMTKFNETVREQVRLHLRGLYDVLELLSNRENYMVVGKPKQIMMKVEGFTQSVDLLKNKIFSYDKTEGDVTTTQFGKRTHYNRQFRNVDYLAIKGVTENDQS